MPAVSKVVAIGRAMKVAEMFTAYSFPVARLDDESARRNRARRSKAR
jgi:hypothetical protein